MTVARHESMANHATPVRAFTLAELLISVVILVLILVATSRIFTTASRVTGIGQATADVMQEAAAIERMIRADLANLAPDGFIAIHSVAVPNDVNRAAGGMILNPTLPDAAMIRCDQLVFFTAGLQTVQTYNSGLQGAYHHAQGLVSRVYWGHAFQLPELEAYTPPPGSYCGSCAGPQGRTHDPGMLLEPLSPWFFDGDDDSDGIPEPSIPTVRTAWAQCWHNCNGQRIFYDRLDGEPVFGTQPESRQWILARQAVLLANDDNQPAWKDNKTRYLSDVISERSIFPLDPRGDGSDVPVEFENLQIRNGRVDVAAIQMNDIWNVLNRSGYPEAWPNNMLDRPWRIDTDDPAPDEIRDTLGTGQEAIAGLFAWPRAELVAPSGLRPDQALTSHAISLACSSFIVEWSWAEGTGEHDDVGLNGNLWAPGIAFGPSYGTNDEVLQSTWFGLRDDDRDVDTYTAFDVAYPTPGLDPVLLPERYAPWAIVPENIEPVISTTSTPGAQEYWAVFGPNRTRPAWLDDSNAPWPDASYTPWPDALRITLVLHDPDTKLATGQVYQFVLDLPNRGGDAQ